MNYDELVEHAARIKHRLDSEGEDAWDSVSASERTVYLDCSREWVEAIRPAVLEEAARECEAEAIGLENSARAMLKENLDLDRVADSRFDSGLRLRHVAHHLRAMAKEGT